VEILKPEGPPLADRIGRIIDAEGRPVPVANPGDRVAVELTHSVRRLNLLRRRVPATDP
jgi:hypothetical protein